MKYTHILWDFNGTLLDDVQTGIDSQNAMLLRRGMKTIGSVEEYRRLFCFPIVRYYERLGYDFTGESFDTLAKEWVGEYLSRAESALLAEGALSLLNLFGQLGLPQTILSATDSDMLKHQVGLLGIRDYFTELVGTDNIYAYGKTELGIQWMNRTKVGKALLIGDTDHDYITAREIGADCVLTAQGHQSRETLLDCGAPVFCDLNEFAQSSLAKRLFS